jgi:serine O-acetyltransferase
MNEIIRKTIDALSENREIELPFLDSTKGSSMPSTGSLEKIVSLLNEILFPGYFGNSTITRSNLNYYIGSNIDKLKHLLYEQIKRGYYFDCLNSNRSCNEISTLAETKTLKFIANLPKIKHLLKTDVEAAFLGDPAAKNWGEVIYCYPGIRALTNYRIAHELLLLDIPLIPRIISEMAHSQTGIDIHPGAQISEFFAIDHGTGIVIGETCIIGKNVKIYQGVTLGAKSFPLDEKGNPIKGIPRHPIVEDNVVIYSGATILGRVTIGKNSMIGGNVWITHNVTGNSKIIQRRAKENIFIDGAGI